MKILALAVAAIAAIGLVSVIVAKAPQTGSAQTSRAAAASPTSNPKAAQPADSQATTKSKSKKPHDCISKPNFHNEIDGELIKREHSNAGPRLASPTFFLPAGIAAELILKEPYNDKKYYFGYIERPNDHNRDGLLGRITARRIAKDHSLVKKGLAKSGDTLLTLRVRNAFAGLWWKSADLYIYTCNSSPTSISKLTIPVSSKSYSNWVVWPTIIAVYLAAAFATSAAAKNREPWYRYLDPVYMTAGRFGRGSLSKLQILFFSMIVFGLLAYIVARTGVLSDLSPSILILLGIVGAGTTISKGIDARKDQISSENLAWLVRKGWIPSIDWATTNKASWRDIITSDGEFDVYRYQSCIVSLIVGVAILAAGINELASFKIPETLLGLLGLSQFVYVGGKVVASTSLGDLNSAVTELRDLETQIIDAASVRSDPYAADGGDALTVARRKYRNKARTVRVLFKSVTGRDVSDAAIKPSLAT